MRIFISALLLTIALTVQAANAAATIPDYQPRPGKAVSTTADPRNANAAMPYQNTTSNPSRFFETPAKR